MTPERLAICVYSAVLLLCLATFVFVERHKPLPEIIHIPVVVKEAELKPVLPVEEVQAPLPLPIPLVSHAQDTWIRALEWCESSGVPSAVNLVDVDGTSSYGPWQFKPATLELFGNICEIPEGSIMDYETQYRTVACMVSKKDEINWYQQFPGCVKKLGLPPD